MNEKTRIALTMNVDDRLAISDLADGRLAGRAFVDAVELAGAHREGREIWHRYHLMGDVMRGLDSAPASSGMDFVSGLRAKLALEPDVRRMPEVDAARTIAQMAAEPDKPANDSVFTWRMAAGVASLTAVLAIGWNMVDGGQIDYGARLASLAAGQVGQQTLTKIANGGTGGKDGKDSRGPQIMLRDPHLDALMAAHKQFGGTSALQMPAGFIRNATFESDSK